jgi:hypothetical protein
MPKKTWGTGTRTIRSFRLFHHQKKKVYYGDLKENEEGRFLKITEACKGKRDTIVCSPQVGKSLANEILSILKGGESDGHLQGNRSSSKRSNSRH